MASLPTGGPDAPSKSETQPTTNDNPNNGAQIFASLLSQIPEDRDYNMGRFLSHPQTPTERSTLGFRGMESEAEVKARMRTQLRALDALLSPSNNPPRN